MASVPSNKRSRSLLKASNSLQLRFPPVHDGRCVSELDLLGIALMVHFHKRVVPFVERTADSISDEDDPIAEVYGAKHGGEHAYIRFRAGDDQAVGILRCSSGISSEPAKAEYRVLSMTLAGGHSFARGGKSSRRAGSRCSRVAAFHRV